MRKARFTEEQIIGILKEHDAGSGTGASARTMTPIANSSFLPGAIALLAPIAWPEPFGLVLIEAMACGTPVIGFNRGVLSPKSSKMG
jgi:glycogen synthase